MVYLNINKEVLEKYSKEANKRAIGSSGDDGKEDLQFDNLEFFEDECYYDDDENKIFLNGTLKIGDDEFAYFSHNLELNFELVISIIEEYRKKLGKLKTVLEAVK